LVPTPEDGVPAPPPVITGEPAVPTLTPRAVATPVPKTAYIDTAGCARVMPPAALIPVIN